MGMNHRGHSEHRGRKERVLRLLCPSPLLLCVLCVLCVFLLSCAGGGALKAGGAGIVLVPPALLSPSGPAADFYATRAEPAVATEPLAVRLATEIDDGRKQRGQAPLVRDGRLDRVAHDIALVTGGLRAPAPDMVAFLLWHYGVAEPEPNLFLLRGDDGAEAAALAGLQPQFARASASVQWRRVGVGVARGVGHWTAVAVFQEKNLDLDPFPRRLATGAHVPVAGRIRAPLHSPEVLVTPPRGAVERPATTVHRGTYAARVECNLGSGVYQVEISAQDARGPRVLANFPVYCGVAPPTAIAAAPSAPARGMDPADAERRLLDLLDGDRRENGLPALVRDARLAAIARGYSREMAETGEVAHVSPRTGSVVERVGAAGIAPRPSLIAENVGSAASAADAEHAFMGSPGHRDNILNRAVTHVGVGVAVGRDEGASALLYFTQVFAGWEY